MLALVAPARADQPAQKPRPRLHAPAQNFWEWLIDPHGREIRLILDKARHNRLRAAGSEYPEYDYQGFSETNRAIAEKLLADARGMLRYGLTLEPDNPDLLLELGQVSDDLERNDEARAALTAYLENQLPDRIDPVAHLRLGRLLARQRDWDGAVVQLRRALAGPLSGLGQPEAIRCLASVYMETGRMADAIDLLRTATSRPTAVDPILELTLAVAYDRDEQVTRAHEVLQHLVANNNYPSGPLSLLDRQHYGFTRGPLLFVPATDRDYYYALLYEVACNLSEARAEWRAYQRSGARFHARAQAHVTAIDALLRRRLGPRSKPAPAPCGGHP